MGVVLAGLAILVFTTVSFVSCKKSSPKPEKKPQQHLFSITPGDGEIIRHLSQPIFVSFRQPVQPSDFIFKIEPDPGGWEVIWDKSQKRVRLDHKNPFIPQQQYHIKLSIKDGSLESQFKTLSPDPCNLLASDLALGVITPDEAAQYHIMRIFNPKSVPKKYRYAKAPRSGTWDILQAANLRDKLKPETVKTLEPYMVRPDNPKSFFYKRLYGLGQSSSRALPWSIAMAHASGAKEPFKEVYQTDTGYTIEIFGEPGLGKMVQKARRLVEEHKMYERFEKLLNRKTADFGDKTLRIYIFSGLSEMEDEAGYKSEPKGYCEPLTWDPALNTGAGTATTDIVISARQVSPDPDLAATLAHEMFHSFQFAFSRFEQKWLMEGSAVWAEDFIGHDWNTEQKWLAGYTFDASYAMHNQIIEKASIKAYGMYLFFYYLTRLRSGGDAIMRQIWENCAAKKSKTFESVRAALSGDLREVFKEYALFTLDVEQYKGKFPDSIGGYGGENPLNVNEYHQFNDNSKINADGTIEVDKPFFLTGMSIVYLKVENKATGITAPAIKFNLKEFLKNEAIAIQAVIKYRNGRTDKEDWTGYEERVFCLANESQNFETLYLVASWAEETSEMKAFFLEIEPALKEECAGAHLRISLADFGQRHENTTSHLYVSAATKQTSSWDRKVVFDLDLTLIPPISPVSMPVPFGDIKKMLPKETPEEVVEFLKYGTHYDAGTHCPFAAYRIKNCRVTTVTGEKKTHEDHICHDNLGRLCEQYTSIYSETWSFSGLDKEWIHMFKKAEPLLGAINVHLDPKTKQIKWVYLDIPIYANCRIDWNYKKEGTRKENSGYREIKESRSGIKEEYITPQAVSANSRELPMNPDWKAKQSTPTTASGGGRKEIPLDRETYNNETKTRVSTTGKHVKTIDWNLNLDVPPDIK
ncbi:MAG: hypothetical protein A4E59_00045 [Syntrophorhabdus sp. PtaB.Bin027]|nr:MAG: hypothetical protein A4E59_00045 [Syntrophorhabdus sp. PtaB.Bin027]OQB73221.1 MAG: hypothetical protein BWX92_03422 [Deltaproteobacteria bacterium ADurb.Bin135]HPW37619.1 hypothetical protein [Syntrophorhabdus sp.]